MTTVAAPAPRPADPRGRRITRRVLLCLATILTILGIVSVWANRQILDSNNWANTSTSLLENAKIRDATATYLVNQLYTKVDVQKELQGVLPPALKPLAGPVSAGLRSPLETAVDKLLATPAVQSAWRAANKAADQAFITVVNGGNKQVDLNNGEVTLNLGVILQDVANKLGVSVDLGSKLPRNIARIELFKAQEIVTIQRIGRALKGLALILSILAPLLFAIAVAISSGRRRKTLLWVGAGGTIAGLIVILFRRIIVNQIPGAITTDATTKELITIVTKLATSELVEVAGATILIGLVIMLCAWFAGPSRYATPVRKFLAPYVRREPLIAFGVVAALLILLFVWQPIPATGRPFAMIVMALLAFLGMEMLRRQMAVEFPGPLEPAAVAVGAGSDTATEQGAAAGSEAPTEQSQDAESEAPTDAGTLESPPPDGDS
jgi:uncharacterized membrane protein YjjB (DUF3815 family)